MSLSPQFEPTAQGSSRQVRSDLRKSFTHLAISPGFSLGTGAAKTLDMMRISKGSYSAWEKHGNVIVLHNYATNGDPMLVAIGAYGFSDISDVFLVWGDHGGDYDDVLDEVASYCEEHAPGLFCDEQVHEAYREAIAEGLSEEEAQQEAESDTTSCDSGNHYFIAHELHFNENPSREDILSLQGRTELRATGKDPLANRKPGNVARRVQKRRAS